MLRERPSKQNGESEKGNCEYKTNARFLLMSVKESLVRLGRRMLLPFNERWQSIVLDW
jgi:hypothetical protein